MRTEWPRKPLSELCLVFTDGDWIETKDQASAGVRLVQTGNVGNGTFKDRQDKARFISLETFMRRKCEEVLPGDCLVSRLPDPVGRACIVPDTGEKMITAVDCTIMRFDETQIVPRFFIYYTQSKEYLNQIERFCTGATRKRISRKNLGKVDIVLPPISDQRRIVAILDEAFAGIDAAIANTEQNLANARELFESVLSSTFSGQGQEQRHLEDVLAAQPRNGWSPPAKNHAHSGTPVLTLSSVTGFRFRPEKIKYTSADVDCTRHYWVSNGDLLITRSNTPELVGHVAIANGINVKTIYPDLIMKMSVDPDKALTKYIYYQLRSPELREEIRSRAQGANPTMKKIGKRAVQTLPVAVPPLSVQKAAVSRIDTFGDECESLSLIYKNKLAGLIELKRALLQKAFSGELTDDFAEKELDEAVA